jgi:hypothetical protein
MAIINDYDAITRRLRELNPATGKDDNLKNWRGLAEETARTYVDNRRQGPLSDMLRRRTLPIIPRRGAMMSHHQSD